MKERIFEGFFDSKAQTELPTLRKVLRSRWGGVVSVTTTPNHITVHFASGDARIFDAWAEEHQDKQITEDLKADIDKVRQVVPDSIVYMDATSVEVYSKEVGGWSRRCFPGLIKLIKKLGKDDFVSIHPAEFRKNGAGEDEVRLVVGLGNEDLSIDILEPQLNEYKAVFSLILPPGDWYEVKKDVNNLLRLAKRHKWCIMVNQEGIEVIIRKGTTQTCATFPLDRFNEWEAKTI